MGLPWFELCQLGLTPQCGQFPLRKVSQSFPRHPGYFAQRYNGDVGGLGGVSFAQTKYCRLDLGILDGGTRVTVGDRGICGRFVVFDWQCDVEESARLLSHYRGARVSIDSQGS